MYLVHKIGSKMLDTEYTGDGESVNYNLRHHICLFSQRKLIPDANVFGDSHTLQTWRKEFP